MNGILAAYRWKIGFRRLFWIECLLHIRGYTLEIFIFIKKAFIFINNGGKSDNKYITGFEILLI